MAETSMTHDQRRLHELFDFDAEAGQLVWRVRAIEDFASVNAANAWNTRQAGTVAGGMDGKGYRKIGIGDNVSYYAHRLIWVYLNGPIPDGMQVDHINGDRDDNRPDNLRLVTRTENLRNQSMPRNNKSGVIGVCWNKAARKWKAQIKVGSRVKYLGLFDNVAAAAGARAKAEREFGFHKGHGKPVLRPSPNGEASE